MFTCLSFVQVLSHEIFIFLVAILLIHTITKWYAHSITSQHQCYCNQFVFYPQPDCSLHLASQFSLSKYYVEPIYSKKSTPGIIMASGIMIHLVYYCQFVVLQASLVLVLLAHIIIIICLFLTHLEHHGLM